MNSLLIVTREISYESGVLVSIKHLMNNLKDNIPVELKYYKDDNELYEIVKNTSSRFINIHVPSFKDETLELLMNLDKKIILSIHSTLCNLQAEENSLERILTIANTYGDKLTITCPSYRETIAMNALAKPCFKYLPNTFSYPVLSKEEVLNKAKERLSKKNIGLFCAYRPLKNLPIQIAACALVHTYNPLHLKLQALNNPDNPLQSAIDYMLSNSKMTYEYVPALKNCDFYQSLDNITVLMQVSLSETLSYVALEHMIQGIPVIGSLSIPFASVIADYNDVSDIEYKLKDILDDGKYMKYVEDTYDQALSLIDDNNKEAIKVIKEMAGDFIEV